MTREFSVVMACRNRAKQMRVSLKTYRGAAEYVFIDDGSTDGSFNVAHDALPNASPRYLYQTGYKGKYRPNPSEAWNMAVDLSNQDVMVMVCPEVAVARDTFKLLVEAVEERVIVLATVWNVKGELPAWKDYTGQDFEVTDPKWKAQISTGNPQQYCGSMRPVPFIFCGAMHRQLWLDLGGYDDEMKRGADGRFAKKALSEGVTFKGLGNAVGFHLEHARA